MKQRRLYQSINDVLPDGQEVVTVPPETPVADAFAIMQENGYSQLPVVDEGRVQRLFSYRSFATKIVDFLGAHPSIEDLTVESFTEQPPFLSADQAPNQAFEGLNRKEAVLVGSKSQIDGILTPMDVLTHLHSIASPFVLVAEIEYCIRQLMEEATTPDELASCADRALSGKYEEGQVPHELEEMTMSDYVSIICFGDFWRDYFGTAFRKQGTDFQRKATRTQLDDVRELRNDVFHLRTISEDDASQMEDVLSWLRSRLNALTTSESEINEEGE